jgi:hypothetical protein
MEEVKPVPVGPKQYFFDLTGNDEAKFRQRLKAWDPGAIALFLADCQFKRQHPESVQTGEEPGGVIYPQEPNLDDDEYDKTRGGML